MIDCFFGKISEQMELVKQNELPKMKIAAEKAAECIENGSIIQLFGCGHSNLLALEVFYRAGGLVPVKPIIIESLMLHEGAMQSSILERKNDFAECFLKEQDIREKDMVFIISTSGRNPVPIDVAQYAKQKGAYVVGITSLEYSKDTSSRHSSGKFLYNSVDLHIDNCCIKGDAVLTHPAVSSPFGPTSTIVGAAILNSILSEAIVKLAEKGVNPPIFLSSNVDGADTQNAGLINQYKERIPLYR